MIYRQIGKTTEQTCKSICSGYSNGCDIITPGASTVAKFKTGFLEIFQISECLKQSVVNAFYVRSPFPTQCPPNATDSTSHRNQPGASYLAISIERTRLSGNNGQRNRKSKCKFKHFFKDTRTNIKKS